ncbi:MAG: tryptophan--tRNA ligase [Thermoproteota archaeon]|nr:MAG: tryptophan--tRNA ligase [Candidatus Korarchaeota archaeon]
MTGNREEFTVTPWEVRGEVNYERLVVEFGLTPLNKDLYERLTRLAGDTHKLLRRGVFFAHRDLDWLLDKYERGEMFYLYTGRGPSGHTHLGHMVPWFLTKWLQDRFGAKLYFQMTDDEKFLFKPELTLEKTRKYALDNALDVIALGFDPDKTKIFLDTDYIGFLYKIALQFAKKITFSTVRATFGLTESSNIGQIFFTSIQAAPAFIESIITGKNVPCLIPLAVDQDPHFRLARDVAPKLGFYKPAILHSKFLPSLSGGGKMSSSEAMSAIFTTDSPEEVRKKIWNAFTGGRPTIAEQREKGGNPDICPVFHYYAFIFEEDDRALGERRKRCLSGDLLCGECKEDLIKRVTNFLKEHQRKRERARDIVDKFLLRGEQTF